MIEIRRATEADFPRIAEIFHEVVAVGDSYVFPSDANAGVAREYWLGANVTSFVALAQGRVVGFYKLKANAIGRGAHVANASFMVDPSARRLGAGREMGVHCLAQARADGFLAMQFNFVVSTNTPAVTLWKSLGFAIVGTLPRAFNHAQLGLVDAYVMYRFLND